ncbi:MAG: methylated-DNA--[protein]-cysteine S-methyltransferase [Candidatus Riflebacteria bacterium]|nr:methylated-DNA--[protein]-cysteine S-methyltransferase [Candidatus Riflebacteria bacterium]
MVLLASSHGLCGFDFVEPDRISLLNRKLGKYYGKFEFSDSDHSAFPPLKAWCENYFNGVFERFAISSMQMMGTAFEKKVWTSLLGISIGSVSTYGKIAFEIGCNSARAVGGAVGSNPFSIIVPCHRVIGANNSLTGYGGGLDRKRWLLKHEGISDFIS